MSQEWMIDVLKDLTCFARQNGLMGLAEQLDETLGIAATELRRTQAAANHDADQDRKICRKTATS